MAGKGENATACTVEVATMFLSKPNTKMSAEETTAIISRLCEIIKSHPLRSLVNNAIQYFASKEMETEVVCTMLEPILKALCQTNDGKDGWSSVNSRTVVALSNLYALLPEKMTVLLKLWWKFVVNAVVDSSPIGRKEALVLLATIKESLSSNKDVFPQFMSYIKSNISTRMVTLFKNKEELYILKLWKLLLGILGKVLHSGKNFINVLIVIPDLAFRHKSESVWLATCESWQALIDNFASNPNIIDNVPRLKLLLQPFKSFNYASQHLIEAQLQTWWHLVVALGDRLHNHIELVVEPLLEICFGICSQDTSKTPPNRISNGLAATNSKTTMASSTLLRANNFKSKQLVFMKFGIPILGSLLEVSNDGSQVVTSLIEPLNNGLLSKKFLLYKHHFIIFKSMEVASTNSFSGQHRSTLFQIWANLQSVVKKCASLENKMECMDFIASFFLTVKTIIKSDHSDVELGCEALQLAAACQSSILTSSAYILRDSGSLHDTPGLLLLELLFAKPVVDILIGNNRFIPLLTTLVAWQEEAARVPVLQLFHAATRLLDKAMPHLTVPIASDAWMILTESLSACIDIIKDVNNGDCLEHNYSCLHEILLFPFRHRLWSEIAARSYTELMLRKWLKLLDQLQQYSGPPLATQQCECLSQFLSLLQVVAAKHVINLTEINVLVFVLQVIQTHVLWPSNKKFLTSVTLPVEIICKFVDVVVSALFKFVSALEGKSTRVAMNQKVVVKCAKTLLTLLDLLFSDLSERDFLQVLLKLAPGLAKLLQLSSETENVLAGLDLFPHVSKMWSCVTVKLPLHFKGPYNTDLLSSLVALIEATLKHPKDGIRSKSRLLWTSTFATSYDKLILGSLKPGLQNGDVRSGDGTESDSSGIGCEVVTLPVPSKCVTPASKLTVDRTQIRELRNRMPAPRTPKSGTRLRSLPTSDDLLDMNSQEFVIINSVPKTKCVLTDHQKEVRASKKTASAIPALYSDLSQDSVCLINECSQSTPSLDTETGLPAFPQVSATSIECVVQHVTGPNVCVIAIAAEKCVPLVDTPLVSQDQKCDVSLINVVPAIIIPGSLSLTSEGQHNVVHDANPLKMGFRVDENREDAGGERSVMPASHTVETLPDAFCDSAMDVDVQIARNPDDDIVSILNCTSSKEQLQSQLSSPSRTTFAGSASQICETMSTDGRVGSQPQEDCHLVHQKSDPATAMTTVLTRGRSGMVLRRHKSEGTATPKSKAVMLPKCAPSASVPVVVFPLSNIVPNKRTLKKRPSEEEVFLKIRSRKRVAGRSFSRVRESADTMLSEKGGSSVAGSNRTNLDVEGSPNAPTKICEVVVTPLRLTSSLLTDDSDSKTPTPRETCSAEIIKKSVEPLSASSVTNSSELIREMGKTTTDLAAPQTPECSPCHKDQSDPCMANGSNKRKGGPSRMTSPATIKKRLRGNTSACKFKKSSEMEVVDMAKARRRSLKEALTLEKNRTFEPSAIGLLSPANKPEGCFSCDENNTTVVGTPERTSPPITTNSCKVSLLPIDSPTRSQASNMNLIVDAQNVTLNEDFPACEVQNQASSEPVWSLAGCISEPNTDSDPDFLAQKQFADTDETPLRASLPSPISESDDAIVLMEAIVDALPVGPNKEVVSEPEIVDSTIQSELICNESSEKLNEMITNNMAPNKQTTPLNRVTVAVSFSPARAFSVAPALSSRGGIDAGSPLKLNGAGVQAPSISPVACQYNEEAERPPVLLVQHPLVKIDSSDSSDVDDPCPVLVREEFDASRPLASVTFRPEPDGDWATAENVMTVQGQLPSGGQESPSGGVLKKQKTRELVGIGSPSPYSKKRKVSFADPLAYGEKNVPYQPKASPRFERGGRFSRCLQMNGSPRKKFSVLRTYGGRAPGWKALSQDQSPVVPEDNTQECYESPSIADVNCTDPIFPSLLECKDPISAILPRLTSSLWTRGLNNMLQSRNIKTVGDLCAMTEGDVQNLPIKSPKIKVVRQSLNQYMSKATKSSPVSSPQTRGVSSSQRQVGADTNEDADPSELPSLEDEMATWSPEKVPSHEKSPIERSSTSESGGDKLLDIASRTSALFDAMDNYFKGLKPDYKDVTLELLNSVLEKSFRLTFDAIAELKLANGRSAV